MSIYHSSSSSYPSTHGGKTEFDVLKEAHRFLREDGDPNENKWEEKVAKKYYDSLFREYAVCDLKHYKSGNFALRWRTESEVISGAGETTCGNTRCALHSPRTIDERVPGLKTLELPFSYEERGEHKMALVKVVLCDKCCGKLMWKRRKEKEKAGDSGKEKEDMQEAHAEILRQESLPSEIRVAVKEEETSPVAFSRSPPRRHHRAEERGKDLHRFRRSRSRSPRRHTIEVRRRSRGPP